MALLEAISLLWKNKKSIVKAANWLAVACLLTLCTFMHCENKRLSESLLTANNNIEAYQGIIEGKTNENRVLVLTVDQLKNTNDSILNKLVETSKKVNVKEKQLTTAATQTQTIYVNSSKGVRGNIIDAIQDSVYRDSIMFNELTSVTYTISKDTINIEIDLKNDSYLYVYKTKEYKNKKNFFKRLITLDFKKVEKTNYVIYDTNDLIKESDVRVVTINK